MQSVIFKDRIDAANELVKSLKRLRGDEEVQLEDKVQQNKSAAVVMAIPRGGIIIGDVIASELGAKLDVVVSRKIGLPSIPSLQLEL